MARISDIIEKFLKELIEDSNNKSIEIGRNELAKYFDCSPSQINYVLTTRFDYAQGYYIESQRGGGGYIKIERLAFDDEDGVYNILIKEIGDKISQSQANRLISSLLEREILSERESNIMKAAIDNSALVSPVNIRDQLRASILKNMLAILLR
ncbi:MAG: CtsR family transcriptional regulator [Clostridiales bacterium]|nr:CtsR family transcriptional regulator [Clostridiales bacterium]